MTGVATSAHRHHPQYRDSSGTQVAHAGDAAAGVCVDNSLNITVLQ
jgi:hypothetical protein